MKKYAKGVGLIELMVALALGLIIVLGVTKIFLAAKNTYVSQRASAGLQEDARFALSKMMQEIRMVGMFGCLATVTDKSVSSTFSPAFNTPISFVSGASTGAVLTLTTADVGSSGGTPTWTILSDCVTGATAYSPSNTPTATAGQLSFPIRQLVYTFKNNQLLIGPSGSQSVLVDNVASFSVTFGVASATGNTATSGYSAAPGDTGLVRSVRLTIVLTDPTNRVRNQTFNVVASLRNRLL